MKRYCQTLDLYDDKELIEAYVAEHAHVWEEVKAGIREVGITDMQIYIDGNRLFMIMDTTDEFDMERDYARLATLPTGGMGGTHGEVPEGCTGSNLAREMETDETDFQIISINTTEKRKGQIYKSIMSISCQIIQIME